MNILLVVWEDKSNGIMCDKTFVFNIKYSIKYKSYNESQKDKRWTILPICSLVSITKVLIRKDILLNHYLANNVYIM